MAHFNRVDANLGIGLNIAAGGAPGDVRSVSENIFYKTAMADTVGGVVGTFSIPNIGTCVLGVIDFMTYLDASTTIYDSIRNFKCAVVITRKVGVVAVGTLIPYEGSLTNAVTNVNQLVPGTIATSAAGATFTIAVTLGAETGGATAVNTFGLTVVATASAGSPTTTVFGSCKLYNAGITGGTFAGANA